MAEFLALFIVSGFVVGVQADDDLSDFSNNLATDLGPLLSLFGDSITIQYLSESTSFLDYFIFAMAPIGIITAIVSTIRVCGSSSLRAFIGRSQEGDASIEAALCTSTSRDVCEMFNKGGITRVLGRPTILELIQDPRSQNQQGLDLFRSHLAGPISSEWQRITPIPKHHVNTQVEMLAPTPNLSLNVGIIQRPRWVFFAVAATGLLLQSFTLALAGVGVWVLDWNLSEGAGGAARDYAPTMFILGTVLVSAGMWSCAALIGQTTHEIRYKRQGQPDTWLSELMWLQPGPQVIGDQSFDPFVFFEKEDKRLKIWTSSTKDLSKKFETHTWIAILMVLIGYIMQFIGLRGMVAWISITQLAITVIMSLLRGFLRAERLNKNDNKLSNIPDLVAKRELDWLAFELVKRSSGKSNLDQHLSWQFYGRYNTAKEQRDDPTSKLLKSDSNSNQHNSTLALNTSTVKQTTSTNWTYTGSQKMGFKCEDLFPVRTRLAYLTGHTLSMSTISDGHYQAWKDDYIQVRDSARRLSTAVCSAASSLHVGRAVKRYELSVQALSGGVDQPRPVDIFLPLIPPPEDSPKATWHMDSAMLEAVLGLWMWSIIYDRNCLVSDNYGNTISTAEGVKRARMVAADVLKKPYMQPQMDLWLGPDTVHLSNGIIDLPSDGCHGGLVDLRHHTEGSSHGSPSEVRLFGWDIIHQGSGTPTTQHTSQIPQKSINIQFVYTEQSLIEICMQELFTALIMSLLNLIGMGETTLVESQGHARLENPIVASTAKAFTEANLGTQSDALMCLVPALGEKGLPANEYLLNGLFNEAKAYQEVSQWKRAEILLRWACEHCSEAHIQGETLTPITDVDKSAKQAFLKIAEFYRLSLVTYIDGNQKEEGRKAFSIEGLSWMQEKYKQAQNAEIREILGCYLHIRDLSVRNSNNPDNSNFAWHVEKELFGALRERRRKDALYWFCFINSLDLGRRYVRDKILASAFALCMRNDWGELAQICLEMDPNLAGEDDKGRDALSYSAEFELDREVKRLIKMGVPLDRGDNNGTTPSQLAVEGKHLKIIFDLLRTGGLRYAYKSFWTLEHEGNEAFVLSLLEEEPPSQDAYIWNRKQDDQSRLRYLLQHNTSTYFHVNGQSPVYWCLVNGESDMKDRTSSMLRLHVENGVINYAESHEESPGFPEASDVPGFKLSLSPMCSPMARAIRFGDMDSVHLLLKAGGQDLANHGTEPPIYWAIKMGQPAILRVLLEHGANIKLKTDGSPWRPLTFAAITGQAEAVRILLEYDNDIECVEGQETGLIWEGYVEPKMGWEGHTSLTWAARYGQDAMVRLLLEEGGGDIEGGSSSMTPLWGAAEGGHIKTVSVLLEKGDNVEKKDEKGRTALEAATIKGKEEMVRFLFDNGGNIHHRNNAGDTLLWTAAWHGRPSVVKLLLEMKEYGAYAELRDDRRFATLEATRRDGFYKMLEFMVELEDYGYGDYDSQKKADNEGEAMLVGVKECMKILQAASSAASSHEDAVGA